MRQNCHYSNYYLKFCSVKLVFGESEVGDLVESGRAFQSLIEEGKKELEKENVLQGIG